MALRTKITMPAVFLSALHVPASHVRCQFIFIKRKTALFPTRNRPAWALETKRLQNLVSPSNGFEAVGFCPSQFRAVLLQFLPNLKRQVFNETENFYYITGEYQNDQNTEHEVAIERHYMRDKLWDVFFTILGGVITGLIAVWINDRQTRKHDIAIRLRGFRDDVSEVVALLQKIADDDAGKFNVNTRDEILVVCARIAEDISNKNKNRFACACADYCEIQERDEKSAAKFILFLYRNPPLNLREPIPNPFRDDQRPRKERMLDALNTLKDCAK